MVWAKGASNDIVYYCKIFDIILKHQYKLFFSISFLLCNDVEFTHSLILSKVEEYEQHKPRAIISQKRNSTHSNTHSKRRCCYIQRQIEWRIFGWMDCLLNSNNLWKGFYIFVCDQFVGFVFSFLYVFIRLLAFTSRFDDKRLKSVCLA